MQEIEVKILEINQDEIERKLLALGAHKHFEGDLDARFYDYRYGFIKNQGDVFRMRKEGETTFLTYKKAISREGAKVMQEIELTLSNRDTMHEILTLLGLKQTKSNRKHRIEYVLGEVKVVIDRYYDQLAHVPTFIEIEAETIELVYDTATQLGYSPEACLPWSTSDLKKHYAHLAPPKEESNK